MKIFGFVSLNKNSRKIRDFSGGMLRNISDSGVSYKFHPQRGVSCIIAEKTIYGNDPRTRASHMTAEPKATDTPPVGKSGATYHARNYLEQRKNRNPPRTTETY
jgi:hypothetical protein